MPDPNSMNTAKGRAFQRKAADILSRHFGVTFITEYEINIGNPPKKHRFDLASSNMKYVGESKNYSWTEGHNVPSAKLAFLNEAVFYLQHLPEDIHRFIVMRRDVDSKHRESIAEYYHRTYKHLLNDVSIIEIDTETSVVRELA